ncbi:MAG TPA: dihydropteroate synthase [Candidatus Dormibacteraeota bacterium]|nr:dihydropteroate synthase [Candidatus Dormibacteraeota bacterium]
MRPVFQWNLGARSLELGKRTLIMGVLNVTPDSFSDGAKFLDCDQALAHADRLLEEGADIIDIGGESTRPGARVAVANGPADSNASDAKHADTKKSAGLKVAPSAPSVNAEEELKRVIPVITGLKKKHPTVVISVDTYKASVARAAVNAGAEIVNDVSGFRWDPQMAKTVATLKCGAVLMHMRGRPEEWRNLPPAGDVVLLVKRELKEWAEHAVLAGVRRERIVLDPGFGFGKSFDENYPLLSRFSELQAAGFPLLAGTSRKSFIGRTLGSNGMDAPPEARLYGTLATQTAVILKGAHIVRTHDVKASVEAAKIADAILLAR